MLNSVKTRIASSEMLFRQTINDVIDVGIVLASLWGVKMFVRALTH
jgi:hypothetical protein